MNRTRAARVCAAAALLLAVTTGTARSQVTPSLDVARDRAEPVEGPAAGDAPPDDAPSITTGVTIFMDYTFQQRPETTDADGNEIHASAFNVGRTYINVTGNISHLIAFRITPDITRESGAGSSLNGSYSFRLKYAFAQFNLDDWMTKGSWLRFGLQQTPWIDYEEGIYRYRFQGPIFPDREGFLTSSDAGVSFHYNLARNYGDVHVGFYNGEGYSKPEANDTKAVQIRGAFRPFTRHPILKGWRVAAFYDGDAYVQDADKRRAILNTTFEHEYINVGFDYLDAKDQISATNIEIDARGFSLWATPKSPTGWEGLLRYDHLEPNTNVSGTRKRTIAGVAYWFPHQGSVSTALLFDVDNTTFRDFTPSQPAQRRIAVHGLVNF